VGNPLAGLVADRFGTRPVVTFAVTCLAVASLGMVPCGEGMPFLAIVLLQGLRQVGVSCLIGPTNAWMMRELEPRHISDGSSFTTAIRQAVASLATALAVFLVTFVPAVTGVEILGYQAAFGLSALCALGVAVLVYAKVR
jgi:MFS family permease